MTKDQADPVREMMSMLEDAELAAASPNVELRQWGRSFLWWLYDEMVAMVPTMEPPPVPRPGQN